MLYSLIAVHSRTWIRAASMGAVEVGPTARRAFLILLCLLTAVALTPQNVSQAAPPTQSAEEGQADFSQRCVACHTIGAGDKIGPDLQGVTERREESWLKVHILSPSVQHDQNDPISVANREQYGLQMPDLGLTEKQVEGVIAYLKTAETTSTVIPVQYPLTLAASALVIIGLTALGLRFGTKKVEVRL